MTGSTACSLSKHSDLPVVLVLNHRYLPDSNGFKVGATSFFIEVLSCLKEGATLGGLLLYKRDESITSPVMEETQVDGCNAVILHFNFQMTEADLRSSILAACRRVSTVSTPIVYYQTDTLLPYHPEVIPGCVTHHGPFVRDYAEKYSLEEAVVAFESREKVMHLMEAQEAGLQSLIQSESIYMLQHSVVQRKYLLQHGLSDSRIHDLVPPIRPRSADASNVPCDIASFLSGNSLILLSVVARVDHFKHLDLLVKAGVELCRRGLDVKVFIAGGTEHDTAKRDALLELVPPSQRACFLLVPKLSQEEMFGVFGLVCQRGVFCCTSRYETLGIAPLEAALSGVCTLMPNLAFVEASRFFPEPYLYEPSNSGLADQVVQVYEEGRVSDGKLLAALQQVISEAKFRQSLLEAFSRISTEVNSMAAVRQRRRRVSTGGA